MEPDLVFQKALDAFKRKLTAKQLHEFSIATLQDVKDEVGKIQARYGSDGKLRGMSRMSKFLEAMQQVEQVITVFLNVSEVVAFIWGPIKFFLVVASSQVDILERLLDAFTDISEVIPDLQGCESIFKDQPEVLEVLKRCYGDIIQFYHLAFDALARPGLLGLRNWRTIFKSLWDTFRIKFSPILGSLRRHRELLEQVKSTATFAEIHKTRLELHAAIEKSKEELKQVLNIIHQKRKQILDKLGRQGHRNDKEHQRLPDWRYPTSGDWLLKEPLFLQWLDPNYLSNDLLYLNGMPGAGKTTLVSRIVDSLNKNANAQQKPLLNFYFEHGQGGKTSLIDMLRFLIEQLVEQDDDIVDDVHETVLPARSSDLRSLEWLKDIVNRTILAQKRCYIIVDGLDECESAERENILRWLKSIMSESKISKVVVKTLVSGQRDGVIDAMLQDCATTIRLDDQESHLRDIEAYSSSVLTQIKDRFPNLKYEEEMLRRLDPTTITKASKGMFMYAKVILDNFLSQTSIYELEQELEREYPHGLNEAYDRVAERVLENPPLNQRQTALQILGLIVCAARPLKWREVQCYFCIDTMNGSCNPRKKKDLAPKKFCGSFIESEACTSWPDMQSEAQLIIVHNTAKRYLLESGRLDLVQLHLQMSLFCFQYLTTSAFDMVNQDSKNAGATILTGFYGFFDYAAAHWDHHSLQYVRHVALREPAGLTEEGLEKPLVTAWMDFVNRFRDTHEPLSETSSDHDVPLDALVQRIAPTGHVDTDYEFCNIHEIFTDWGSTRRSTEFETLAVALRQVMQQTDLGSLENREKTNYLSLNGPFQLKCSRRICVHFNTGFKTEAQLSRHVSWHEMAFKCPHMGCYAWLAGFPTSAFLQTHLKRAHPTVESKEELFPVKSRSRPQTLMEACRLGDIKLVRAFSITTSKKANMLAANRALHAAARSGHFDVCVHLTKQGANPYAMLPHKGHAGVPSVNISVMQMCVRLGDLDLFSALRSASTEHHKLSFIKESLDILDCILDALESPIPRFLVHLLHWNELRTKPLTLNDILLRAVVETQRQEYGCRTLSYVKRHVSIEHRNVRKGLETLISREFKRREKDFWSPSLCYEQIIVGSDASGQTLLHRLCEGRPGCDFLEAVRFLLTKLTPQDTRRCDLSGNPPLFSALRIRFPAGGAALNDQANIVRSFFDNDLDGSKNTRNADGQGPLEFALGHANLQIITLVFELCGADSSVLQLDDILAFPTDRGIEKIPIVFGLHSVNERIQLAVELVPGEINDFVRWLTDLDSESEVLNTLQTLIRRLPQEATGADSANDVSTSNDHLQYDNAKVAKVSLILSRAFALPKRCRPWLEDLGRTQVHKLLTSFLRAKMNRLDIADVLSTQHTSALRGRRPGEPSPDIHGTTAQGMDADIISLLRRHGGYMDFSSTETQYQLIQTLGDSLFTSRNSGNQRPSGLIDYYETLIQYADAVEDDHFVASLEYIRQYI